MSKNIVIDGEQFDDMRGFYDHVTPMLTDGIGEYGHNLDAFCDMLRGGLGAHYYGEPLEILWKNFGLSRERLGDRRVLNIISVILASDDAHECTLKIEE